ncbi:Uncharacterised protein [Mycobacteroides abscessus subsp. abscessus]|nr:Uncharacterised protein [Mycobacteroides abscessus subsp. abscessus]
MAQFVERGLEVAAARADDVYSFADLDDGVLNFSELGFDKVDLGTFVFDDGVSSSCQDIDCRAEIVVGEVLPGGLRGFELPRIPVGDWNADFSHKIDYAL